MTTREIAQISGLTRSMVHKISMLDSWDTIPVGVAQRFAAACGVNLMAQRDRRWLLRVRSWSCLARSVKPVQRAMLDMLLTAAQRSANRAA